MNCGHSIWVRGERRSCLHLARYRHTHYAAIASSELRPDGQPALDIFTWEHG